jgi:glycosyltransferase involved in cell wall biosynthesis
MTPWLSVVVPVYNGEAFLSDALGSLRGQDDRVEILVVDDGSTDRSMAIVDDFAAELTIEVIRPGRLGNWVVATNAGLERARGEYVSFLHQDDTWLPGRLAALRSVAGRDPCFVVSPSVYIDGRGRGVGDWRCPLATDRPLSAEEVHRSLLVQNFLAVPAPIVPRALIEESGGLDADLWYTADWDLWLRAASRYTTRVLSAPFSAFRLHADAQTIVRTHDQVELRRQLETVLDRHLPAVARAPDARQVERIARASINLNVALASARAASRRPLLRAGVEAIVGLGPVGTAKLLHRSRLFDRVNARRRVGLGTTPRGANPGHGA